MVPIIIVTGEAGTPHKIALLESGADDYVVKPFSADELVARVRSVLRRTQGASRSSERLRFADLEMDEDSHEVWRGELPIELTVTEFSLLRYLLMNARRVLSKAQILDHVWQYDFDGDPAIVETYISYLRKKVDLDQPPLIHTVRGVGYVLRLPRE